MERGRRHNLPDHVEIELALDDADDEAALRARLARKLQVPEEALPEVTLTRRSLDARRGAVRFRLRFAIGEGARTERGPAPPREVAGTPPVVVVGDGPGGMFCAYQLARSGRSVVVLDRGKEVQPRRRDLALLNREGAVNADSNYCFGEGGAGTYSDGKLYTRASKRGDVQDVLQILVEHGAPAEILTDARPHVGSNRLPRVVRAIRDHLEQVGVVFRFGCRVTDLLLKGDSGRRVVGVRTAAGQELEASAVVLATGHSARDVHQLLERAGVPLEPKAFAMGVRIEHPQPLVNEIQYGVASGHPKLPAAAYRLAMTADARGVFSFCMCPGGFIVPASTEPGGLVVNGMSLSRRDSPFANSGLVVSIELEDVNAAVGASPLAGVQLQDQLERTAFVAGGGGLAAPATRVTDFLEGRASTTLPPTSYQPGLSAGNVAEVLDAHGLDLSRRLRVALRAFNRRMPGYVTEEGILVGVESRTSSPVRVPRDAQTLEAIGFGGLYPCGEGAGYAGGIVSAAMDGIAVGRQIVENAASGVS